MNRKTWLRLVVVVISAATLAGGAVLAQQKRRTAAEASQTAGNQDVLVLTGILGPTVTIPIEAPGLQLTVPLNSYVVKGQVIGEAPSTDGLRPGMSRQTPVSPEDADAAVDEAADAAGNAQTELETARDQQSEARVEQALAEVNERATKTQLDSLDQEFQAEELSVSRYYHSQEALASAEAATDAARTKEDAAASAIRDATAEVEQANDGLAKAERSQWSAYATDEQGPEDRWADVVSPADGYVVVRDPATGAYGIGSNDSSLRVVAQVPEQYLFGLRVGQKAQVSVDLLPEVILSATIRSIDEVPIESATGHLYTVTFTVANPRGLSFDAEPVHIRIAGSAQ